MKRPQMLARLLRIAYRRECGNFSADLTKEQRIRMSRIVAVALESVGGYVLLTQTQLSLVREAQCMCRYRAGYTALRSRSNYNHGTRYTLDKRAWGFLCVLASYFSFSSSLLSTNAILSRERETRSACRNFRRYFRR